MPGKHSDLLVNRGQSSDRCFLRKSGDPGFVFGGGLRKIDCPWRSGAGDATPELAIDEISEATRRKTQWNQGSDEIRNLKPPLVSIVGKEPECNQYAEKASMKTHSALPDREHVGGVFEIVERLVEQHIAEPATEYRSENAVEKHVVDIARMPARQQVLTRAEFAENDDLHESEQVHEPVPAHRKR